jgi:hypothetical protein
MASFNNHTIMICTAARRQDTNNLFRAVPNETGGTYDSSPVNSVPGTLSVPLAVVLDTTSPWTTTPTHYLGGTWELPLYADLMASIKDGTIDLSAINWANFNLTAQRARAAGQSLYTRTQVWDPNGPLKTGDVVAQNIAAALLEYPGGPLLRIPGMQITDPPPPPPPVVITPKV